MRLDETFLPIGFVPGAQPAADMIRVGGFQSRSMVAGPGLRSVVWVAGCHRRCPGCIKPEWLDFGAGSPVAVEALAERLLGTPETVGVSFSGGEPFEQAGALATVARRVRASGRTILVYTGYRHEVLRDGCVSAHRDLLAVTDILIDGEYRADAGGVGGWRGSANQRVLALSPEGYLALQQDAATGSGRRDVQLEVTNEGLRVTGCPEPGFMKLFTDQLASRGVLLGSANRGGHGE